jgi:hypothetical protein
MGIVLAYNLGKIYRQLLKTSAKDFLISKSILFEFSQFHSPQFDIVCFWQIEFF